MREVLQGRRVNALQGQRRELQVHCYRMLGSFDESEDLVQETFLRAWRGRESFSFRGPCSFRAWLYRVATNACLDALRSKPRQPFPWQLRAADDRHLARLAPPQPELAWLQPYPDRLLDGIAPSDEGPDAQVVARETIELAFGGLVYPGWTLEPSVSKGRP